MTEEAYFNSLASADAFKALGVERYEFVATLDEHTCELCQPMDGKVFKLS
jgi:Tfp pilus assembly protein FimV